MANEFYDHTSAPAQGAPLSSAVIRAELDLIEQGFDKLPTMSGNALEIVRVNSSATALETIPVASLQTDIAAETHAATGKTTPVDADEIGIVDSESSNVLKKLTWANLKATVKTYFDTLYSAVGHNHSGVYEPANANLLETGDIGSSVQGYDADTMKSDVETDITGAMTHTPSSLTDGANIDWNLDTQQNATVTLGGNRVMNAPTNAKAGRYVGLRVVQDGTGGRTLTFASAYKGMTGITPVTTASAVNFYLFRCIDTTNLALVGFRSNCEA